VRDSWRIDQCTSWQITRRSCSRRAYPWSIYRKNRFRVTRTERERGGGESMRSHDITFGFLEYSLLNPLTKRLVKQPFLCESPSRFILAITQFIHAIIIHKKILQKYCKNICSLRKGLSENNGKQHTLHKFVWRKIADENAKNQTTKSKIFIYKSLSLSNIFI